MTTALPFCRTLILQQGGPNMHAVNLCYSTIADTARPLSHTVVVDANPTFARFRH